MGKVLSMPEVLAPDDHICLNAGKDVHVFPVDLALSWAEGKVPLPEDAILRRIVTEWLACVRSGCVTHAIEELSQ